MITAFRRYLETWVVRGFFLIMVLAFISWGVGDVVRLIGASTWAAKVGGQTIEGAQLQQAYQRDMAQITRTLPPGQEPTQAVRQAVFAIPAFRGPNGQFDRATFEAALRNNGLTEARFLEMLRGDLSQRQLLGAVAAGATAPETLLRPLFQGQSEKRSADMVEFPVASATEPPAPAEAELQRWYDNHPDSYSAPEYRRIKAIVLSPQTVAKDVTITDDDLKAAYQQHRADYVTPAKRSVQVVSITDEAKAKALAE